MDQDDVCRAESECTPGGYAGVEDSEREAVDTRTKRPRRTRKRRGPRMPPQFCVSEDDEPPKMYELTATGERVALTNFIPRFDCDVRIQDVETNTVFEGDLETESGRRRFRITAADYADNHGLRARLYEVGGATIQVLCLMDKLRQAVSALSNPRQIEVTKHFGMNADGSSYLVPGGCVSANGFERTSGGGSFINVDLRDEEKARHLRLGSEGPDKIAKVRHHIINEFVRLQPAVITLSCLAFVALAVLHRFSGRAWRFVLWLVGPTGAGKSFLARLIQCFFGDFLQPDAIATWGATVNFLERQGYYFRDCVYLVDDYKRGTCKPDQVVKLIHRYADGTSRGRLKRDASTNRSWPIRGMLLSTGEELPEHRSSLVARCIPIRVPHGEKNIKLGHKCMDMANLYPAFTASFLHYVFRNDIVAKFKNMVDQEERSFYHHLLAGRPNDARIASNFGMLMAAFEVMAEYLSDIWKEKGQTNVNQYRRDLRHLAMSGTGDVSGERASVVFMDTLRSLLEAGEVVVESAGYGDTKRTIVGKIRQDDPEAVYIFTRLALREVAQTLSRANLPPLDAGERSLVQQLREDGVVLQQRTRQMRLDGSAHRVLRLKRSCLFSHT